MEGYHHDIQDSILPIVSLKYNSHSHDFMVTTLLDSGSQKNFILENLALKMGLKTIQSHVDLNLKGFVGEKKIIVRTVQFPFMINGETRNVECICLPQLHVRFAVPYMSELIDILNYRGLELAYKTFYKPNLNMITKIDCVIGCCDWNIVNHLEYKFIKHNSQETGYYLCDKKVIPVGSVKKLIYCFNNCKNSENYCSTEVSIASNMIQVEENSQHCPRDEPNLSVATKTNLNVDPNVEHILLTNTLSCSESTQDTNIASYNDEVVHEFSSNNFSDIMDIANYTELNEKCNFLLNLDQSIPADEQFMSEGEVTEFVLKNTKRSETNRIITPIPWIARRKSMLQSNENLALSVLRSVQKKYRNDLDSLVRINDVFKKQIESGIIELVDCVSQYKLDYPKFSFLSHFPLIKDERQTTKVRVIYMANLAEKTSSGSAGTSLNQTVHPGFCKNSKIASSFIFSRFERYLLCMDIQKAFHQLEISNDNSSRFLFYWFRNVGEGDFTPIVYRFRRLIFGMSVSPFLLTCALHSFLIDCKRNDSLSDLENQKFNELKKLIYHGSYVDNLFVGCDTLALLKYTHDNAVSLFNTNQFLLQQFVTNHAFYQDELDLHYNEETPNIVKILGMLWKRDSDTITAPVYKMKKNISTKRQVLSEINKNFDLMGTNLPLLSRAKLFLRELQIKTNLSWDSILPDSMMRRWKTIVRQFNEYSPIEIPRCVGKRTDSYEMYIFSDASKQFLGFVIYLKNLNTGNVSFLVANNRMLDKVDKCRTIPVLELAAIEYSVVRGLSLYQELSVTPVVSIGIVNVRLFSDSMVALAWLNQSENVLNKMQKRTIYVNNRIRNIVKLCGTIHPIQFSHIGSYSNSADYLTRLYSPKRLAKTAFISGPQILKTDLDLIDWISVPNPQTDNEKLFPQFVLSATVDVQPKIRVSEFICLEEFSSLKKPIRILFIVKQFIAELKKRLFLRDKDKYRHLTVDDSLYSLKECERLFLVEDQSREFPELVSFFEKKLTSIKKIPPLVSQMNLFLDSSDGLIKVRSKFGRLQSSDIDNFPVLLSASSLFMKLSVLDFHKFFSHSGVYFVLNQLRRRFFILKAFSSVKRVIQNCIHCRRFNARPIKVNTNKYPEFMINTKQRLFATTFVDYVGPYITLFGKVRTKTYLILFKCFWSKAIHVEIVISADTKGFLMALQNFIYLYGIPQSLNSDAGSSMAAGFSWLRDVFDSVEVHSYLDSCRIKTPTFSQYPRGSLNKGIPGFIESGVKVIKRLISGSIKNNVLEFIQFSHVVKQAVCFANKRPITNVGALRDQKPDSEFHILTPEVLKLGYSTCVMEISSPQRELDEWNPEELIDPRVAYKDVEKLIRIKNRIRENYYSDFLQTLQSNATHLQKKYQPVKHFALAVGDVVLIRDPFLKQSNYPLGRVVDLVRNNLDEVTKVRAVKGNRKYVTRDVSDIIFMLRPETPELVAPANIGKGVGFDRNLIDDSDRSVSGSEEIKVIEQKQSRPRLAADKCKEALKIYYK